MEEDTKKTIFTITEFGHNILIKKSEHKGDDGKIIWNDHDVIEGVWLYEFMRKWEKMIKELKHPELKE
jgi:hypothetical protein